MEVLSLKEDGNLWAKTYDTMPVTTVQAILIAFTVVQLMMIAFIMVQMFKFTLNGISWSHSQVKSRTRGFFMVFASLILPLADTYVAYEAKSIHDYTNDIPELQSNLMPNWILYTIYGSACLTGLTAITSFFTNLTGSKTMLQNYMNVKFLHFAVFLILVIFMVVNLILFDNLTGFGVSAYLDDNWPRVMKLVDYAQFDAGLTACAGGKYVADAPISPQFDNFECPKSPDFGIDMRGQDYIALLWELKGDGVLDSDDTIYGCLNPVCSNHLKSGLTIKQSLLIIFMVFLAFLHAFAIGLAIETLKPHIHYKSALMNTVVFLLMAGIIFSGVFLTVESSFEKILVNPESVWEANDDY